MKERKASLGYLIFLLFCAIYHPPDHLIEIIILNQEIQRPEIDYIPIHEHRKEGVFL